MALPPSIILVVAVLTVFLSLTIGLKYGIENNFTRTRIGMTAFFFFIIFTLSVSFGEHFIATLPYTIPGGILGFIVGYFFGVTTERQKLMMQGFEYYMEHFAQIRVRDFVTLTWWSFVNFYTVMGALVLINFVGISDVLFAGTRWWAIVSSAFGAFLIGTIVPYLIYLWTIRIFRR